METKIINKEKSCLAPYLNVNTKYTIIIVGHGCDILFRCSYAIKYMNAVWDTVFSYVMCKYLVLKFDLVKYNKTFVCVLGNVSHMCV
jgi:hypothetical protein